MRKFLVFFSCICALSCTTRKSGIIIESDKVSIFEQGISIDNVFPVINQTMLRMTGYSVEGKNTIIHFLEPESDRKIDLVFRRNSNDSLIYYQISARLPEKTEWQSTDTLKVLFKSTDPIQKGIYSVLNPPEFCWAKPVQFTNINLIGEVKGIQCAYWEYTNNIYAVALPMGGNNFAFSLGNEERGFGSIGTAGIKTFIEGEIPVLSLSLGSNFYKLMPASYEHSFDAMGIAENMRMWKTKPDMYNYLGWASWNAFKHDLSEGKIVNAAESFKAEQIPVKWFLIDDGWLDETDNKLNRYTLVKKKFPNGLKNLTSKLRDEFGITDVGLWHTLNGYWEGLSYSGSLVSGFNDIITYHDMIPWLSDTIKPLRFINPFSDEGYRFYDEWYKYMSSQGITFIKVDNQMVVRKLAEGNSPLWQTGEKVFSNMHSAAAKYFNGNVINCMSMGNSAVYHYSNTSVARTVGDYNPDNDENLYSFGFYGNAAAHILASVHNSVWLSNIVWPDWDMFQSNNRDAWYYAIGKVISNGPVYITDEPGKHNAALLNSITYDGGRVIISDKPALPTEDCLFQLFESETPLKVSSLFKNNGLLAAWNVSDRDSVTGSFTPARINGLSNNRFVVFEFFSKSVSESGFDEETPVRLSRLDCSFYSLIPLTGDKAVIGDISKVIPMVTVSDIEILEKSMHLQVNEQGTIWIYSKSKPASLKINSINMDEINYDKYILSIEVTKDKSLLEIEF